MIETERADMRIVPVHITMVVMVDLTRAMGMLFQPAAYVRWPACHVVHTAAQKEGGIDRAAHHFVQLGARIHAEQTPTQ